MYKNCKPGMHLNHIVATTPEGGIGLDGTIPWKVSEDMAHFKRVTTELQTGETNVLIMGRKTWESIPQNYKPLKDRTCIVLSSKYMSSPHCVHVDSLKGVFEAILEIENLGQVVNPGGTVINEIFVIGGEVIYKSFLRMPFKHTVYRTIISRVDKKIIPCDTFFPAIEEYDYKMKDSSEVKTSGRYIYQFQTMTNFN